MWLGITASLKSKAMISRHGRERRWQVEISKNVIDVEHWLLAKSINETGSGTVKRILGQSLKASTGSREDPILPLLAT